jgi:hypothetical protein
VVYFWAPGKTQIRPFQFRERRQYFIRVHNVTLPVIAMRTDFEDARLQKLPNVRAPLQRLPPREPVT